MRSISTYSRNGLGYTPFTAGDEQAVRLVSYVDPWAMLVFPFFQDAWPLLLPTLWSPPPPPPLYDEARCSNAVRLFLTTHPGCH